MLEHLSKDYRLTVITTPRPREAHKGDFGHVLVVGGNKGLLGAAAMAGCAAARVGAGLVSLATHPSHAALIASHYPELMAHGIETEDQLSPLLDKATALVIGPGFGQDAWARVLLKTIIDRVPDTPSVIDADALAILASHKDWLKEINPSTTIFTPHPGEAARLLGTSVQAVQADRPAALKQLEAHCRGHIVLKGAGTLISSAPPAMDKKETHEQPLLPALCTLGNPGMATGGMGDILSGVMGGLLAQHFAPAIAARLGVCVHAQAADQEAREKGERGMMATDLLPHLRTLMNPVKHQSL